MSLFSKKPVEKLSEQLDEKLVTQPVEKQSDQPVEMQSEQLGEKVICTGPQCRKKLFFLKPPNRPLCNDCIEKLY
jgi:hypothetical protein